MQVDGLVRHLQLPFGVGEARRQSLQGDAVAIEIGAAGEFSFSEVGGAFQVQFGLLDGSLDLVQGRLGCRQAGFLELQLGTRKAVVQHGQQLARLHGHAFLDEHLLDLARGLGTDRRLAPGDDVSGGVQHDPVGSGIDAGADHVGLDPGPLDAEQPYVERPGDDRQADDHRDGHEHDPWPARPFRPLAVNLQLVQERFLVHGFRGVVT